MIKTLIVPAALYDDNREAIIKEVNVIDPRLHLTVNRHIDGGYTIKIEGEPDSVRQMIDLLNQY